MKKIPSNFFQIPSSENVFLNKSFIPASGNLFSALWKQYVLFIAFFLMLDTII